MGLDLQLLPFDCDNDVVQYSHTILNCERHGELFRQIGEMEDEKGKPVRDDFRSYLGSAPGWSDVCYGKTIETPYGDRLRFLTARDLKAFEGTGEVDDYAVNRAIWAYLCCLPDETKVALYWS